MKNKIDVLDLNHAALNYVEKLSELHDLTKEVAESYEESKQIIVNFLNQCLCEDLVSLKSLKITSFSSLTILKSAHKCIFAVFVDSKNDDYELYEVAYEDLIFKDYIKEWVDKALYLLCY
nr:MAG TPA: hypothetical protein [Caudoviricetes sp.]